MKTSTALNIQALTLAMLMLLLLSCETLDLDQNSDPSKLSPENADPELLLNNVQLQFVRGIAHNEDNEDGINVRAAESIRMQHLFGGYTGPFSLTPEKIDDLWISLYREALQDIELLIPLAEERELQGVIGVAQILKAYTYVILVDTFGDVPFSEANQGNNILNPNVDDDQDIYNAVLELIDEAIETLTNAPDFTMPEDLFYNIDNKAKRKEKWLRMARTLKFKMYVQMRLSEDFSTEINALISKGLITNATDDFQFQYATAASATGDSRHPYYALNYDAGGANDYLNSYYVHLLKEDKGFEDPRLRYYFYRQTNEDPSGVNLPCDGKQGFNFCYLGDAYWTRDHGDESPVPNDGLKRTTYGLYPIGGAFDADTFLSVTDNPGAQGAGIFPFLLSSYVKFLQAESALMSGTTGNPRTLLEEGIRASMNKVLTFNPSQVDEDFAATPEAVNDYVDFVLGQFDAATTKEEKLDIIIKEYYIALWGNGIEAWNNYRRTSLPSDLSPHVASPGDFPRSFFYPTAVANANTNINQKPVTEKVFWDTNPDILD